MGGTCCSCMFIAVCPVLLGTDCADWDKERKAFPALGIYWICSSWRRQESCEQSQESVAPVERLGHCNAEQEQPVRLWRVPGTGGGLNYLLQFRKLFTGLNQSFGVGVKASLSIFFEGLMVEMRSRQFDMKALVVSGNQCSPQKTGCIVNALANISDKVCTYVVKNGRKKHAKETQIEWNIVVSSASLSWDGAYILWCSIYISLSTNFTSLLIVDEGHLYAWGSNKHGQLVSKEVFLAEPKKIETRFFSHEKIGAVWSGWTHLVAQTGRIPKKQ